MTTNTGRSSVPLSKHQPSRSTRPNRPKTIDFTYMSGFSKGKTIKGIYKIDRRRSYDLSGSEPRERPSERVRGADGLRAHAGRVEAIEDVGTERLKAVEDELNRFEATWKFVSIDVEGRSVPAERFGEDRLVLKGKQFTTTVGGTRPRAPSRSTRPQSPRRSTSHSPTARARTIPRKASTSLTATPRRSAGRRRGSPDRPNSRPSPRAAGCFRSLRK